MNDEDCKKIKKVLRNSAHKKIADFISATSQEKESENAAKNFLSDADVFRRFSESDIVLGYVATETECDCMDILKKALCAGKLVALPRVKPNTSDMDFFILDSKKSLESQLEKGSFGIKEPKITAKKLGEDDLNKKSVFVIVPGVLFTSDGKRLGHGKGFYDRYIPRLKKNSEEVFLCGYAFSCQKSEKSITLDGENYDFPCDAHDELMDAVIFS